VICRVAVAAASAALLLLPAPAIAQADRWFAEDKLKHFAASFVATTIAASGARAAGLGRTGSLYVGVGVGAGAGLFKEVHDARAGGFFSVRDMTWNAAGIGAGFAAMRQTN
jgi:uncharacterized protein YfiM (DUF2279 family)